ncbi:MazG nucleotide pyrophosphohydrolase domain-containing protein [Candidatus Hodarchaeum mangrovi]
MENSDIKRFQQLMEELYGIRDKRRGIEKTLLWLLTEVGELMKAYLKDDITEMKGEVADIFAWLSSTCNLLKIDLAEVSWEKYPLNCPKCCNNPCNCPEL